MVEPFFRTDRNACWDCPEGARDGGYHDAIEDWYRLVARDDKDGPAFFVWCFEEPKLSLSYQGSASVMASALASASLSSSSDWGISR